MNDAIEKHVEARVFLVSAASSGTGKTTVTAALARTLQHQGLRVRLFKTGPDFLDPMLLERASGAQVGSLDVWMVGLEACRAQLAQAMGECDVVLIEGVMGLYDGTPSSFDLARAFGVPVLLVIDAGAMAQTAGALVQGLRDYGPIEVAGVIANRVGSKHHADMVAASLRNVPLLATLAKQVQSLPERHLGLVTPAEVPDLDALLDHLAQQLVFDNAAWARLPLLRLAVPQPAAAIAPSLAGMNIGVARDAAFAFLYPANLACLRALGAQLQFFSPLNNEPVPAHADAVYLPGGYPELHAQTLSEATIWQASIRQAHADHMPIWAECGGMMALADTLLDQAGRTWPMAGVLPGAVMMQARLAGLGPQAMTLPEGVLRGHTFHYSRLETALTPFCVTLKNPSRLAGEAVYCHGSLLASYFHAYFPSCPQAAAALFWKKTRRDSKTTFLGNTSGQIIS
ncbi:cobyrinate a,c-diamide synthase [Massilia psychrophila]|uniref:Cobyrinate a,c-diamide synthase n=1 Tax=Massilia psychrophila TaxID=1603353 RepID=A0A2G8T5Q3_9BURK|nr:cobyrinate a,c-diamide synthase [Massilia psychrophila]PIL41371.1 cobyrinate a,c-diamide synthase [Massilia psychrophila]